MWLSRMLIGVTRLLLGANPRWLGSVPTAAQRIYFANHTSHADTVVLWAALPPSLRARTRPVAAADYWGKSRLRRFIVLRALNAVLIDRSHSDPDAKEDKVRHRKRHLSAHPLESLFQVLDQGDSLIIFPEGTRRFQALPGPFKSGLFHLAERYLQVELIPVYLENLHRSMPKGSFFPVPMICNVRFGAPLQRVASEDKQSFLNRARNAVIEASQ